MDSLAVGIVTKLGFGLAGLAWTVALGIIWAVAQTGASETNAHLCELAHSFFPDVSDRCRATETLLTLVGWVLGISVILVVLGFSWITATWWNGASERAEQSKPLDFFVDQHERSDRVSIMKAFIATTTASKWADSYRDNPDKFKFDARYPKSVTPEERTAERLVRQLTMDLHDKLREGKIRSWGRPVRHDTTGELPAREIESKEWDEIEILIDARSLASHGDRSCAQTRSNFASRRLRYVDVEVPVDQIVAQYGTEI